MTDQSKTPEEILKARWFWFGRWVCRVFCILFFRVRTYGKDNIPRTGAFIIVSNHQSYLDPIFCGGLIKRHSHFIARDSLFTNWFFGPLISSVNAIPVKLGEPDISAMRKVLEKLKKGDGVTLFPEGTRTYDGKITPFKPGLGLLARRGNATIVPALIDGAFECWPRHRKLFSPGQIHVTYGKPITVKQVKDMGDNKLAELLTETLRKMQTQSRIKQNKKPYKY
ncbi:MAG: 1-acyl-sn-glycerol-3-phosphate acyltransferase [Planctomycetes bacterium]|nr:1-acyl-sn-glycerol-3-phosphate acyltransferase [Planctomycetota bacterium]